MISVLKMLMIVCVASKVVVAEVTPTCSCGVFKATTPDNTKETPILVKNPTVPFDCDEEGREKCAKMCVALAQAAKESGPKIICEIIGTTEEPFVPAIYSKSCDDEEWTRTKHEEDVKICCDGGKPIPC